MKTITPPPTTQKKQRPLTQFPTLSALSLSNAKEQHRVRDVKEIIKRKRSAQQRASCAN